MYFFCCKKMEIPDVHEDVLRRERPSGQDEGLISSTRS